ncbi:MAG: hypothetical protein AAFU41_06370 [Pseudomonadota bacterium]
MRNQLRRKIIAAGKDLLAPASNPPKQIPLPGPIKSDANAKRMVLSQSSIEGYHVWNEPNRADTPVLHIGESGARYSTITGVWWLEETRYIACHRSGLRAAVFDLEAENPVLWTGDFGHLSDDIAAKPIDENTWEVAVSGCWENICSRFTLTKTAAEYALQALEERPHESKDFSHGVAYDEAGQLCIALHTGVDPRIYIGKEVSRLPKPWGARDVCFDAARNRHLAIAVSANPRKTSYTGPSTSLWEMPVGAKEWVCVGVYQEIHSDALDVWGDHIWFPDQVSNALISVNAATAEMEGIFTGDCFDFPHGLGISPSGVIAVTNYGTSSIALISIDELAKPKP